MANDRDRHNRAADDDNPLGLGARDAEGAGTGSTEDTSYDARDADPYTTGEPRKPGRPPAPERDGADPETTSSEEP